RDHDAHPAAVIAGRQAEQRTERGGAQHRERRDDEDRPRAPQNARHDVAAQMIGAEPVRSRRCRVRERGQIVGVRSIGRQHRREDREHDPHEDDREADRCRSRRAERGDATPNRVGGPDMAPHTPRRSERLGEPLALLDHRRAHGGRYTRIRGSRTMYARSPRMFVTTARKTATSAPASMSAMSLNSVASSIMRPKPGYANTVSTTTTPATR